MLAKYQIRVDISSEGKTGYKGFEGLHVDFCDLTYEKIGSILDMIIEISKDEKRIPELKKESIKTYIKEVIDAGLLNRDAIHEGLLASIDRYCNT